MGGTAKKVTGAIGQGLGTVATGGLNLVPIKNNPFKRIAGNVGTIGTLGLNGQQLTDFQGRPLFGDGSQNQGGITGPFSLDPAQLEADRNAILGEGNAQYEQALKGISETSQANTKRAADLFKEMLPDIAENAQAAHLYDSTGYGSEVARQQSQIASEVANQEAQQRLAALGAKQGFQTGALQRGLSLQDFINQANVAKTIGAQMAPPPPSSKATGLSTGIAGAAAGAPFGPLGAGLGGFGGLALGSQVNRKGK